MEYGDAELRSDALLLRFALVLTLLVLGSGATCLGTPPPSQPALEQQRRCIAALSRRDLQRAHTTCRLCLQFDPFSPECHNGMGLVAMLRGDDAEARTRFKKALRLKPDFAEARNNLGVLELEAGKLEAAAKHFTATLRVDPGYLDGRYNLAQCHLRQGQRIQMRAGGQREAAHCFAEAELEYLATLELQPAHVESLRDLAALYSLLADLASVEQDRRRLLGQAIDVGRRCLQIAPANHACHGNLAQLLLGLGRCAEAQQHAAGCLQSDPGNAICQDIMKSAHGCALQQQAVGGVDGADENAAPGPAGAEFREIPIQ